MHPFSHTIEGATVLVGVGSTTFGTGFIVEHRDRVYVVTCRHVILEAAASSTSFFAIPRPQKTKTPPGGYTVLSLGRPISHPEDAATCTYDIAVLRIANSARKPLRALGILPSELGLLGEEPTEGLTVVTAGYPVAYVEPKVRLGKLEPLRPWRASGTVKQVPLAALTQDGFGGMLCEGFFAQTSERPLGKGASGGAVYVDDGGRAVRVVGVQLAIAEVQIREDGRTVGMTRFVFASSHRILETLG